MLEVGGVQLCMKPTLPYIIRGITKRIINFTCMMHVSTIESIALLYYYIDVLMFGVYKMESRLHTIHTFMYIIIYRT